MVFSLGLVISFNFSQRGGGPSQKVTYPRSSEDRNWVVGGPWTPKKALTCWLLRLPRSELSWGAERDARDRVTSGFISCPRARKGSEVKPFNPVLSDWWNETISNRELVPVPLPLRLREGSRMKKMTRLASGKTGSGREDRPYMAQLRPIW